MIPASDAGRDDTTMDDDECERLRLEARSPSAIADTHILVGARSHVNDHILSRLGVRRVLCVYSSCRFAANAPYTTHHCALSDYGDTDISAPETEALAACLAQIDAAATAGERILVHCSQGINRSPTVVMAWLIVRRQWTLARAHEHVCACRTQASVHEKYFDQLQLLEQRVHGVAAPSLTREQIGPSLQEAMRQLRRDHARESDP